MASDDPPPSSLLADTRPFIHNSHDLITVGKCPYGSANVDCCPHVEKMVLKKADAIKPGNRKAGEVDRVRA